MKVNKKALFALAAYYDALRIDCIAGKAERVDLVEMFIPCIKEAFNEDEITRNFMHAEVFFRSVNVEDTYVDRFNDANIAKLLRYIASKGKFPRARSLRYV